MADRLIGGLTGAGAGALAGSTFGLHGAIVGGIIGGVRGIFGPSEPEPELRVLSRTTRSAVQPRQWVVGRAKLGGQLAYETADKIEKGGRSLHVQRPAGGPDGRQCAP